MAINRFHLHKLMNKTALPPAGGPAYYGGMSRSPGPMLYPSNGEHELVNLQDFREPLVSSYIQQRHLGQMPLHGTPNISIFQWSKAPASSRRNPGATSATVIDVQPQLLPLLTWTNDNRENHDSFPVIDVALAGMASLSDLHQAKLLRLFDWGRWIKLEYQRMSPRGWKNWILTMVGSWVPQDDYTAWQLDYFGSAAFLPPYPQKICRVFRMNWLGAGDLGWKWEEYQSPLPKVSPQNFNVAQGPLITPQNSGELRKNPGERGPLPVKTLSHKEVAAKQLPQASTKPRSMTQALPLEQETFVVKPVGHLRSLQENRLMRDIEKFNEAIKNLKQHNRIHDRIHDRTAAVVDQVSVHVPLGQPAKQAKSIERTAIQLVRPVPQTFQQSPVLKASMMAAVSSKQYRSTSHPPGLSHAMDHTLLRKASGLDAVVCQPQSSLKIMVRVLLPVGSGWQNWVQESLFNLFYLARLPLDASIYQGVKSLWFWSTYQSYAHGLVALMEEVGRIHGIHVAKVPRFLMWVPPLFAIAFQMQFNRFSRVFKRSGRSLAS